MHEVHPLDATSTYAVSLDSVLPFYVVLDQRLECLFKNMRSFYVVL